MSTKKKAKQSTEAVMRASLAKTGAISLNLTVRLKDPTKKGQYGHYRGASLVVQATSVDDAKKFATAMRDAGIKLARSMGLHTPGLVFVEAGEVAEG